MNATAALPVVGIDLAKNAFEAAVADADWRIVEHARLSRMQFERWFANRGVGQGVMEACGSAHHWGRWLESQGIAPTLLPARYVRVHVKRNKTEAADAAALLEACRASSIVPVRIKSIEPQALHRTRSRWMGTRTSRINALRGFCREFGIDVRAGSRIGLEQIGRVLADPKSAIPALLRPTMKEVLEEIRLLEARIGQLEREWALLARQSQGCAQLLTVPGIGLLTATAMVAATGGTVQHFRDARHFASWFGLTPKEHSSGSTRRIGRISKRGDRYLRMLLTHGARSVRPRWPIAWALLLARDREFRGDCTTVTAASSAIEQNIFAPRKRSQHRWLRRTRSDGTTGQTGVVAKPAPDEAPTVRVSDRGADQHNPPGTAGSFRAKSPDVRVQSSPSRRHGLSAWQTGAVHVRPGASTSS